MNLSGPAGQPSVPGAAIVLQARMGSVRLPGKVLADLGGRTILQRCVERLRAASGLPVILATTTRADDDCLLPHAARLGVPVLRGPDDDVLARYALAVSTFGLTTVIRATADNPAVDLEAPARTLRHLIATGADHVVDDGLPPGSTVEAISAAALVRAAELATDGYDREHVTPFMRRDRRFVALTTTVPDQLRRPDLRLSVDTAVDLAFMRQLFAAVEDGTARHVPLADLIRAAGRLLASR